MIVKSDKTEFQSYLTDAANISGNCEEVYFPETTDEIRQIIEDANKNSTQVTVSGARTGLTGGGIPDEGIILSTEKLNKIISINSETKTAIVQPGVQLSEIQLETKKMGLFYPPDPTELNCTIGGTVANNASGARTFKYGPTRNFINRIAIVLPNGREIDIRRGQHVFENYSYKFYYDSDSTLTLEVPDYQMPQVKHAAGYFSKSDMDLIDLFIGAEGTLGIITEIELQLLDLPSNILSMIVFFENEDNLFKFVDNLSSLSRDTSHILNLREIEFFDRYTLNLLSADIQNIPNNSSGAIWLEQEMSESEEEELLGIVESIIEKHNGDLENIWFAFDENERGKFKEFRHSVPLKVNDIISSRNLIKVGTDTAVPDDKFRSFYYEVVSIFEKNCIDYVVYGHIGNSHLHFNMLPKTKDELDLCRELYAKICDISVQLGGTISAEHGIGKLKRDYLLKMFGEENIIKMAKTKKMLDPNCILNIGNIFDPKYLES